MHESGAVVEFLDETWEILDSLSAACTEGKGSTKFSSNLKTIERSLHTIKGNAAAFGFDELSDAASRTLDWLRSSLRNASKILARPQDLPPVLEFTARLRQYLALLNPDAPPLTGFWSEPQKPTSRPIRGAGNEPNEIRSDAPATRSAAATDWEAEVKEILSRAPLVTPKIDEIVWMAIQKLTGKGALVGSERSGGRSPPAPATPEAPLTPAAQSSVPPAASSAKPWQKPLAQAGAAGGICAPGIETGFWPPPLHAYAFEAALKAEWLRRLEEKCHSNSLLEGAISEISDLLASFGQWSAEARRAPLASFLSEPFDPGRNKSHSAGLRQRVELTGGEIPVLPPVGKLINVLLGQLTGTSAVVQEQQREPTSAIRVGVTQAAGSIDVSVSGLAGLERATSRLQLDLLRQRIEKCGVSMTRATDSAGESCLLISLPRELDGMEVLVVRGGDQCIGLPGHRVQAILDLPGLPQPAACERGRIEINGESFPLLDLSASQEPGAHRGEIVLIRTDKERGALKVDKVLHREGMILSAPAQEDLLGAAFSLCLSIEKLEWMPFLWCSSRLFEQQESLGSRP